MIKRNKRICTMLASAAVCLGITGGITFSYNTIDAYAVQGVVSTENGTDGYEKVVWDAGSDNLEKVDDYYIINNVKFWVASRSEDGKTTFYARIKGYIKSENEPDTIEFPDEVIINGTKYNVTGIDEFSSIAKFKKVKIPSNYTGRISVCQGTCEELEFADGFNFTGSNAGIYFNGQALKRIKFSNTTTYIPEHSFESCNNVKSVIVPASVNFIGYCAFFHAYGGDNEFGDVILLGNDISLASVPWRDRSTIWVQNNTVKERVEQNKKNCQNHRYNNKLSIRIGRPYIESYWDYGTDKGNDPEVTIYGMKFKKNGDNTVSIIGYNNEMSKYYLKDKHVVIPNSIVVNEVKYDVNNIAVGAFNGCSNLQFEVSTDAAKNMAVASGISENNIVSGGNWYNNQIEIDGITYEYINENEVRLLQGSSAEGNIKIPESIYVGGKKYAVTKIAPLAFLGTSIIAGESNIAINKITGIEIPNTVTEIGESAFSGCKNLNSVKLPNNLTTIGNCAFENCANITELNIPESVTSIGKYSFNGCTSLQVVNMPKDMPELGSQAFENCGDAVFNITNTKNFCFANGGNIKNVVIRNEAENIAQGAFAGCTNLSQVVIPETVTEIGESAFSSCTSLSNVTLPNNLTTIGNCAFQNCANITELNIPESVTSIGEYSFDGCTSLQVVNMPKEMPVLGSQAFANCGDAVFNITNTNDFCFANWGNVKTVIIREGAESIAKAAFAGCTNLSQVIIPEGVREVGEASFSGCTSIKSICLPEGLTKIDNCAFENCSGLEFVTIPDSVQSIGECAFLGDSDTILYVSSENVKNLLIAAGVDSANIVLTTEEVSTQEIEEYASYYEEEKDYNQEEVQQDEQTSAENEETYNVEMNEEADKEAADAELESEDIIVKAE